MKENYFYATFNEYKWAVFQGPMTAEKIVCFSKATLDTEGLTLQGQSR